MTAKRSIRCALYTRKSTEEGLEQDFNSLDAQREACEAYVTSQKAEGCMSGTTTADIPEEHWNALPSSGCWRISTKAGSTSWSSTRSIASAAR